MRVSRVVPLLATLTAAGCGAASELETGGSTTTVPTTTVSTGSGGTDAGPVTALPISVPVGTFQSCGIAMPELGPFGPVLFLGGAGQDPSASLTITQEGSTVSATLDYIAGSSSFTFTPTSEASAVLVTGGPLVTPLQGNCTEGPDDIVLFPAAVTPTAGALTYDDGAVFLSLTGSISGGAGTTCGEQSASTNLWVVCGDDGSGSGAPPSAPAPVPVLPAGSYTCSSLEGTQWQMPSLSVSSSMTGTGVLTLTQSGATVTATYTGDSELGGTLVFTATSPTTAAADPAQTMGAACQINSSPGPLEPLVVDVASLAIHDKMLLVMVSGSMPDAAGCAGAQKIAGIACPMP